MTHILNALLPIATIAVALALVIGLWNMMRGGSGTFSQKVMRARVILQFFAIILTLAVLYIAARQAGP